MSKKTWEKSRLSNQNTAEESLLNITGIQGVLILYVCVWAREWAGQLVITDNSLYGGTPHPTSVPNWNQNHADNYFFTTLKMTVINCYQQYPPKVTSCICIKRKSTLLAILNAFLYIYNILGVFPQALIQQIYIHETDQIVPRLIPQ